MEAFDSRWSDLQARLPAALDAVDTLARRVGRDLAELEVRDEARHGLALALAAEAATPEDVEAKLEKARTRLAALLPHLRPVSAADPSHADALARYARGRRELGQAWPGAWPDETWTFLQDPRAGEDLSPDAWACRAVILGAPLPPTDTSEANHPTYQLWPRLHEALHHVAGIPAASFLVEEGLRHVSSRFLGAPISDTEAGMPSSKVFLRYHAALGGHGLVPCLATGRLETVGDPGLRRALALAQLCESAAFARAPTEDFYRRQFDEPSWFDAVNIDGLLDLFELSGDAAALGRLLDVALDALAAASRARTPLEPALASVRAAQVLEHQRVRGHAAPPNDLPSFLHYLAQLGFPAGERCVVDWIDAPTPQAVIYPVAAGEAVESKAHKPHTGLLMRHRAPRLPSWLADQMPRDRSELVPGPGTPIAALLRAAAATV